MCQVFTDCAFPLQIENIMASLDAGLSNCDITANGVTSSHDHSVALTMTVPQQLPATGASAALDYS